MMAIMNSKMGTNETIMAIMNAIIAIMISKFQIMKS